MLVMAKDLLENSAISSSPVRKVEWQNSFVYYLIDKIREHPVLWDRTHEHFAKKTLKRSEWSKIAAALQKEYPALKDVGLTEDDVQQKFAKLKTTFQREVKKIHCTKSGSGEYYEPKWKFFNSLSFMLPRELQYLTTSSYSSPLSCQIVKTEQFFDEEVTDEGINDHPSWTDLIEESSSTSLTTSPRPATPSSSSGKTPPSHTSKKRKRTPADTSEATHALVAQTMLRVHNVLAAHERPRDELAEKSAELVRSFASFLSESAKPKFAAELLKFIQNFKEDTQ